MAKIIVNDFPAGPARWPGQYAGSGGPDCHGRPRFAANDTTLRFSQCDIGERPPPRTSPSQEPRQGIRVRRRTAGQWSGVTPGRCQGLP